MKMPLNQHLMELNGDVLKGWLRRVGALDKLHTRKEQFARAVESQLTQYLPEVVARLSLAEKCFLAECIHQGRLISSAMFQAKYGAPCPTVIRDSGSSGEIPLLVPFMHVPHYRNGEEPYLLPELVARLDGLLPKLPGLTARKISQIPKAWPAEVQYQGGERIRPIHVYESERLAPVELGRVLRLIQSGKVKVTDSTQRSTDAATRLIAGLLVVPDFALEMPDDHKGEWQRTSYTAAGPVRAHAWPVLVQQCGWAKAKNGVLALTAEGRDILEQFTPEKFRAGFSRCLSDGDFDELIRINHIRGQTGKAQRWLSHPGKRKTAIGEAMIVFPVGEWLKCDEAHRLVEASGKAHRVLEGNTQALYFFDPQFGFIYDDVGLRSQFLRAFFMESLATLGLVDVAYVYPHSLWPDLRESLNGDLPFCGRYDGLLYVRLNPLGAYALNFTDHYDFRAEERPKLFRVLPNLDLVLTHDALNPADRASLELLAAPRGDMVWTLDAERMLTHVETGGAFKELRDFLEANAAEGLPDNVQVFLAGIESKLGAGRTRRDAVLVEWADEALAQLIATSAGTNKLCFHAGANRLVVPAENLTAFGRALKRLGYVLPRPQ